MIEVGEYVRTNDGRIFRVYKMDNKNSDYTLYSNEFTRPINYKIVKHSKNIIDLIEAEDIIEINKEKYEVIYDESLDKLGVLIPNRNYLGIRHSALEHIFKKYENISILTKEQYMKNCYLVERKKEC